MAIYFDQNAEIKWDEFKRMAVMTTSGYMSSEQLRSSLDKLIECLVHYRGKRILIDMRKFTTIRPADQEWIHDDWGKRLESSVGKAKTACILPEDNSMQKMVLSKVVERAQYTGRTELKYFGSPNEAILWLS